MGRKNRLTGERPQAGVTPDSLLTLHDAGYRAVVERLGPGRVLDVGCGEGFETVRLGGPGRQVVGIDRDRGALAAARRPGTLALGRMEATALGFGTGSFDWVCSSHLIEHFVDPSGHVAEVARVTAEGGTAYFLTPNAPADFENPFHLHPFEPAVLGALLSHHFTEVEVRGLESLTRVKADFAARRARAARLLALDVLDLRHRVPCRWYVAAYTRLLPAAYRLLARGTRGGASGITAEDWFVADAIDDTTPVLFAECRRPRYASVGGGRPGWGPLP